MSNSSITPHNQTAAIAQRHEIGAAFDKAAAYAAFMDYRSRKAENTLRAQDNDLNVFAAFLALVGATAPGELPTDPAAWAGISYGLVEGFRNWLLQQGYAIGTVNRRLSTIKKYAKLAAKAGVISVEQKALIADVNGYSDKEAKRVNEGRENTRRVRDTGKAFKKAEHVSIPDDIAKLLKTVHPNTPDSHLAQARRDAVLMALLLDHGLRVGEVALLDVSHVDLKTGELKFYRPKVDKQQTHRFTGAARQALKAYFDNGDAPAAGKLIRRSLKSGKLGAAGMSENAITKRVRALGKQHGISGLSAHDCRHYWATRASRNGTNPFALQEAGGWNSLAMPRRYVEDAKIANEGVNLGGD